MVLEEPENRPGSASPSSVPMVDEDDDEKTDDSPENVERFTAILGETKVNVGTSSDH
jgi:hypothetical protein